MHSDNIEIVRSRYVDLRPSETAVAYLRINPRARCHDWITTDDSVGDVAAGRVWLAEIDEGGAEGAVDHLPKSRRRIIAGAVRAGVVEFLNRDDVRLQPL